MRCVLVDTSVWIDFFGGRLSKNAGGAIRDFLDAEKVAITDVIRHELLVGAASVRDYDKLDEMLSALTEVAIESNLRPVFNRFSFELKMKGLLGRYTDLSIAFLSQYHQFPLISFDQYFGKLAKRGVISMIKLS